MYPHHLYVLALGLLLGPHASASQQSSQSDTLLRREQVQDVLDYKPPKDPGCTQFPTGPIETTSCDFETIESVNEDLYSELHKLVETPFFKYFRVDLYRECPFWQDNGFCMNRECGITTVDESEIPERWRAAALSKLEMPPESESTVLPGCYYRDSDYCFLDDMTEGDYIDLSMNPERFTGYTGPSAHRVWSSIYQENCFGMSEPNLLSSNSPNPGLMSSPDSMTGALSAEGEEQARECLERRVYHKIISGLHTSISTHICHDTMNQSTGEWGPDLKCFISRVASHPERLEYLYFDTVLLLRAVARLGTYLSAYDYCGTGTHEDDAATLAMLGKVIGIARAVGKFDETVLFRGEDADILKVEFKEHFRNVSRIMDCVGCDKCRLWGKVQTTGVGTALKVLFELDEKALDPRANSNLLQRSEVVALVNTLHRFVESVMYVNKFRRMWADMDPQEEDALIRDTQADAQAATRSAPKPHRSPVAGSQDVHDNFLENVIARIACWMRACKDGTVGCFQGLLDGLQAVLDGLKSIFQLSGKDQVPRSDL
ncbi:hypothetical protein CERSUDRAFT_83620 [Gelatoporia subvermispora B]|uniref:Endoplasmic oxidoreductin n=1 Tax=Ceriporiopsis subvermispora (strain B) TaxID=914234 RepID=M2R041_CERS8|nr:hypothetical protein CERSUDRAFT_83620 [Gelatoporia subvermispora B]